MKLYSSRLLGLTEWRTMRLPPGEAEILCLELVAPYQPAPPTLAVHFEDFTRLQPGTAGLGTHPGRALRAPLAAGRHREAAALS